MARDRAFMLKLPAELLDMIFEQVRAIQHAECLRRSTTEDLRMIPKFQQNELWQSSFTSIRTTCKTFHASLYVNKSLFGEFFLYPHIDSLQKLKGLAEHELLRHMVKIIVFMVPQFNNVEVLTLPILKYRWRDQMNLRYRNSLEFARSRNNDPLAPITSREVSYIAESLTERNFKIVWSKSHQEQIHKQISQVRVEQESCLDNGTYIEVCAWSLARLINSSGVIIHGGDGSGAKTYDSGYTGYSAVQNTYIDKNYPHFDAGFRHGWQNGDSTSDARFLSIVLRVLALSGRQIKHFLMEDEMHLGSDLKLADMPLGDQTIRDLVPQTAALTIRGLDMATSSTVAQPGGIRALLEQFAPTLRELTLTLHENDVTVSTDSNINLCGLNFPKLQSLHVLNLEWGLDSIVDILSRHPTIRHIKMTEVGRYNHLNFPLLFRSIRAFHRDSIHMEDCQGSYNEVIEMKGELASYLHGHGPWTASLEGRFPAND